MANFMIATMPITGHVVPALPIAQRLVAEGHDVRWYTGAKFRERIEAVGAAYLPMREAPDFDDKDVDKTFAERVPLNGLAKLKWDLKHLFIDAMIGQVRDLEAVLDTFAADVIVCDTAFLGGLSIMERRGIPAAYLGITPFIGHSIDTAPFGLALPPDASPLGRLRNRALTALTDKVIFREVHAHLDAARATLGLPRSPHGFFDCHRAAALFMLGTIPGFEYPRSDLPANVRFIGPLLPAGGKPYERPDWWNQIATKTVVHVTQGTIANHDFGQLVRPAIEGLAGEDVLVIAATGGKPVAEVGLTNLRANARIEEFIPYAEFMPHVDVYLTNGGYGGVQFALANGVPIITCGTTEDKPEINARVEWAGVGINLKTDAPSPAQIRDAVKRVLSEKRFTERARAIQAEMVSHDAPQEAARLLVELASHQRVPEGVR